MQRVAHAEVRVDDHSVGAIHRGLLVLLGVGQGDDTAHAEALARKVARLRIFEDEAGKMNRSVTDVRGSVLVVSQFTLYADTRRGNRPSFLGAAPPETADGLYEAFTAALSRAGVPCQTGTFRAGMQVALVNDGPVTLHLDTHAGDAGAVNDGEG
ncbi:MAG: D-aminoacyl-tRNA deacylase [Trueperaceae bacterium]|nr:D-aminoacyl-tRNA deacylase [Trueperaceae bacterium]